MCGNPMPIGEESFRYHGYSGDCPPKVADKPSGQYVGEPTSNPSPTNNEREELRARIGALKPHTETQLPLGDILSYLEMNALIDVVIEDKRQTLERLKEQAGWFDASKDKSPKIKLYKVVPVSAIDAELEKLK